MADPSCLLPPYKSETTAVISAVDDAADSCIAATAIIQLLQATLISFAWVFDAQQTFVSIFTDTEPKWHCVDTDDMSCSSATLPCSLPSDSWAWDQPKHTSIVSEWGLECAGPATAGLPESAYFAGCLVGGLLLTPVADLWLGRKKMLFLSCLIMSVSALLATLSPNVWAYSTLRFICGLGRATIATSALVLSSEIVGKRWQSRISIMGFVFFALGFVSLPAMAYFGRGSSWRSLYLWTSIPSLLYSIAIYFLVSESPRWLSVHSQRDEAINTLTSIVSAVTVLFGRWWVLKRLTAVMSVGLGVGMVYYGMPLNVGNLSTNLYLSVVYNALAELPSSLLTFAVVGKLNRRSSLLMFTTMSGVCSMICAFPVAKGLQVAFEVVSFFSACTACNVLLIYSVELFPTCIRSSAISMVRQALVFGAALAPILVAQGRKKSILSFGVFGLVMGFCGLFALCLPETRESGISDTLEEEEHKELVSSGVIP